MESQVTTSEHFVRDRFHRGLTDLRISLTDQCNLRCTYCMPKEIFGPDFVFLRRDQWLRFQELDDIVEAFVKLGVEKIRLTGGEPLLRPGLTKFIAGLRRYPSIRDIAMTTNGLRLSERISDLKDAGLHRVTVSLDALDPEVSGRMNGRGISPKVVIAGIESALEAGLGVKVNMVVERGVNEEEVLPMARFFKNMGVPLRFIEFMDTGNHNGWRMEKVFSGEEILSVLRSEFALEAVDLSSSTEVAKRYRYADGSAEVGLVTSVTSPFCGGCTRARISADGFLYTCLFASKGLDLKKVLRCSGYEKGELFSVLSRHWRSRGDRYSELRTGEQTVEKKVEMSYIGG
ncbi:MAG: GTP 3',8-cyclase MoaA [Verrucomicrobiota bacterium]